jgi:hypothetical protein
MSDIPLASTQQLTQALSQLSKLAPQSEAARLGVEVIVKHLSGNLMNVSLAKSTRSNPVSLPKAELQGQLQSSQNYSLKISSQANPVLQFFSSTGPQSRVTLPISEQQLQAILRLPANQIAQSLANAIAPIQSRTGQSNFVQTQEIIKNNSLPVFIDAKVTALSSKQITLSFPGQTQTLSLNTSPTNLSQFRAGETLQIALEPRGQNWQIKLLNSATQAQNISQNQINLSSGVTTEQTTSLTNVKGSTTTPQLNSNSASGAVPTITIPRGQAEIILKAAISAANSSTANSTIGGITLALKSVLTQLSSKGEQGTDSLVSKLASFPAEKVTLIPKQNGQFELSITTPKLSAQLPISKEILAAIAPLKLPLQQIASQLLARLTSPQDSFNPTHSQISGTKIAKEISPANILPTQVREKSLDRGTTRTNPVSQDGIKPTTSSTELGNNKAPTALQSNKVEGIPIPQGNRNTLNQTFEQTKPSHVQPNNETNLSKGSTEALPLSFKVDSVLASKADIANIKPEQVKLIHTLLRVVQAKAELPAETLNRIQQAMSDPLLNKESSFKELIEPLTQQIRQALPQGKESDANQIRQLLATPPINLSSAQLVAPPANQGLLGGLVALLQISLASRLLRNQPFQLERIMQALVPLTSTGAKRPSSTQASKGLADFFQVEQKHQLLKEISRLLSGHQANKLANAEQLVQGQESFYYTLPSAFGDKVKDIELLIKREDESQKKDKDDEGNAKSWHLTMKLGVGELGELLTKAKLRPDHLEVDFYASNDATKIQVLNFMPLLKKRLESLGIEVAKSKCQLGKIPQTLQQRPYHVFETKA